MNYKFVRISEAKRKGMIREGYGDHSYYLTDVEKTIIDCFDLPQYSGGYAELIRAFATAKLSAPKMLDFCKAVTNVAVTKRMGLLAELFEKKELKSFIHFAKEQTRDPGLTHLVVRKG